VSVVNLLFKAKMRNCVGCSLGQNIIMIGDAQMFQKSWGHLKTLGARRVASSNVRAEDPKVAGATIQNFVARATLLRNLCTPDNENLQDD